LGETGKSSTEKESFVDVPAPVLTEMWTCRSPGLPEDETPTTSPLGALPE
jgi:hypothetical protein